VPDSPFTPVKTPTKAYFRPCSIMSLPLPESCKVCGAPMDSTLKCNKCLPAIVNLRALAATGEAKMVIAAAEVKKTNPPVIPMVPVKLCDDCGKYPVASDSEKWCTGCCAAISAAAEAAVEKAKADAAAEAKAKSHAVRVEASKLEAVAARDKATRDGKSSQIVVGAGGTPDAGIHKCIVHELPVTPTLSDADDDDHDGEDAAKLGTDAPKAVSTPPVPTPAVVEKFVDIKVCLLSGKTGATKHQMRVDMEQPKRCGSCVFLRKEKDKTRPPYMLDVEVCKRLKKHQQWSSEKQLPDCTQCIEIAERTAKRTAKRKAKETMSSKKAGLAAPGKRKTKVKSGTEPQPQKAVIGEAPTASSSSSSHSSLGPNKTKTKKKEKSVEKSSSSARVVAARKHNVRLGNDPDRGVVDYTEPTEVEPSEFEKMTAACNHWADPSDNDLHVRPYDQNAARDYSNIGIGMTVAGTVSLNIFEAKVKPVESKKDELANLYYHMKASRDHITELLKSEAFDEIRPGSKKKAAKRKRPAVSAKAAPKKAAKAKEPEPAKRKAKSGEHCDKDGNFVEVEYGTLSEEEGDDPDAGFEHLEDQTDSEPEESGVESDGNDTRGAPKTKSSKN
jgi:hypothetical protein